MIKLYDNDKTKQIDQLAASYLGVDSFELMQLAGAGVYEHVKSYDQILIITGPGNNGGDGFVVAELARQQGQTVHVLALKAIESLSGDAQLAAEMFHGEVLSLKDADKVRQLELDMIVDAIFGTGLDRVVSEPYAEVIGWLNQQNKPVLAVDIPSGLNGSTGCIEGVAVNASDTVAILAHNTGLFTADGRDCCGQIQFESLHVPESVYSTVNHAAELLDRTQLNHPVSYTHLTLPTIYSV